MLWKTMYRLGDMTENDLRLTLRRELFSNDPDPVGRRFWERSREAYLTNVRGRREQRFFDIVEDEYRGSLAASARSEPHARLHRIGRRLWRGTEPLIVGGIIAAVAGRALTRLRTRLRTRHGQAA